jgi:hypothetical protein
VTAASACRLRSGAGGHAGPRAVAAVDRLCPADRQRAASRADRRRRDRRRERAAHSAAGPAASGGHRAAARRRVPPSHPASGGRGAGRRKRTRPNLCSRPAGAVRACRASLAPARPWLAASSPSTARDSASTTASRRTSPLPTHSPLAFERSLISSPTRAAASRRRNPTPPTARSSSTHPPLCTRTTPGSAASSGARATPVTSLGLPLRCSTPPVTPAARVPPQSFPASGTSGSAGSPAAALATSSASRPTPRPSWTASRPGSEPARALASSCRKPAAGARPQPVHAMNESAVTAPTPRMLPVTRRR